MKPTEILDEILLHYLERVRESVAEPGADANSLRVALATLEKFDRLFLKDESADDPLAAVKAAVQAKQAARRARTTTSSVDADFGDSLH